MRIAIIIFLMLFAHKSTAQPSPIKGRGFRGIIFDTTTFAWVSIEHQKSKYALTVAEVTKAESILRQKLATFNKERVNQGSGCPVIHENLKKYYRQYVGFLNSNGDIAIWINFFWDKQLIPRAAKEIIMVADGCSYHWNVEVNITTGQLSNLHINGMA